MFAYGAQPPVQDDDDDDPTVYKGNKGKQLPFHGNRQTMNLNPLILTNIQGSPYYKVELFKKRAFLEVVDEIYYKVDHLEPWERGSRGGAGMRTTGMCGGGRGVSAGGIVSSSFCLLYKLFTLKLTEKQAETLINHQDSPYIRGLGFMYLRFTQPPGDLWDWFEPYMDDQEQIDVKAGGGKNMAMGDFLKLMLTKLEWFDTRFPRIPAAVEKMMRERMEEMENRGGWAQGGAVAAANQTQEVDNWQNEGEERSTKQRSRSPSSGVGKSRDDKSSRGRSREKDRSKDRRDRSKDEDRRDRSKEEDRKKKKDRSRDRSRERSKDKERKKRKDRSRDRSRSKNRSLSKDRTSSKRKKDRSRDRSRENRRSKESDRKRGKDRSRERSRSKDKDSKRKKDRSRSSDRSKKVKSKRDRSGTRDRDRERKNGREKEDSEYADQLKRFKKLKRKEKRSRSR